MFENSYNLISGGNFTLKVNQTPDSFGLHFLYQKMDPQATYDSTHWRTPRIKNSNVSVKEIMQWLEVPSECSKGRFLWITDSTSHIRTALAYAVSETCKQRRILGASFFFPQSTSEKLHRKSALCGTFIPTIIYQLIIYLGQDYADYICKIIASDPSMLDKSPEVQFENLLVEPLKRFPPHEGFIMVINGLDVCEEQEMQRQVNSLLCADLPNNVRFIILSRPRTWMRDFFANRTPTTVSILSPTKPDIGMTLRERIQKLLAILPCIGGPGRMAM